MEKWLFERLLRPGIHRKGGLKFPFQYLKMDALKIQAKINAYYRQKGHLLPFKKPPIQQ
jgi:hypothetical protein